MDDIDALVNRFYIKEYPDYFNLSNEEKLNIGPILSKKIPISNMHDFFHKYYGIPFTNKIEYLKFYQKIYGKGKDFIITPNTSNNSILSSCHTLMELHNSLFQLDVENDFTYSQINLKILRDNKKTSVKIKGFGQYIFEKLLNHINQFTKKEEEQFLKLNVFKREDEPDDLFIDTLIHRNDVNVLAQDIIDLKNSEKYFHNKSFILCNDGYSEEVEYVMSNNDIVSNIRLNYLIEDIFNNTTILIPEESLPFESYLNYFLDQQIQIIMEKHLEVFKKKWSLNNLDFI